MQKKSRAQEIVDRIRESERYKNARSFEDRVYGDEPILRTGAQAFAKRKQGGAQSGTAQGQRPRQELFRSIRKERKTPPDMPAKYAEMRGLQKRAKGSGSHSLVGSRLFYEQGKFMEDFTDDYQGACELRQYVPAYNTMSDTQLRCYFTWRTHLRAHQTPPAPLAFLYIHAYELLCGIGCVPGQQGFEALRAFADAYAGVSVAFDAHVRTWLHDYVVFYDLDPSLVDWSSSDPFAEEVVLVRTAQKKLLEQEGRVRWPSEHVEGLPAPEELIDALCLLSRYRGEKSRFFREYHADAAEVTSQVFARMVEHCHKRRKTDFVEGMFGEPMRVRYAMFASAMFWTPEMHPDAMFEFSKSEVYMCFNGFWWRITPCRRRERDKGLGTLLHTIDARMRFAYRYPHVLKERNLPKYQSKIVNEEIEALLARKKAVEDAQIRIDRASLASIRSAAERTREALLTDEERDGWLDEAPIPRDVEKPIEQDVPVVTVEPSRNDLAAEATQNDSLGLSPEQVALLEELLAGSEPTGDAMFLSLAADAINEVFLDVVGDIVVEFEGGVPVLIEDYVDDVREALEHKA